MASDTSISTTARVLGFTGLLPQAGALVLELLGRRAGSDLTPLLGFAGARVALAYAAVILSFLGGIWWGFAIRRGSGQGPLVAVSVLPSLIGVALLLIGMSGAGTMRWPLVALGSAILLTLPVERHLVGAGDAPAGWMRLRVPLSVGLGALTILAGVLAPG